MTEQKLKFTDIPLGVWDFNGNWYPSLNLNLSESEQRRHNMVGGHYKNMWSANEIRGLIVADTALSLFEKIKKVIENED